MQIDKTPFKDLVVLTPKIFADNRGYFFESHNNKTLDLAGLRYDWVQDNQSHSTYGVIRGLHFQKNPAAQTKLVRVLQGEILDVVVDLRRSEPTFGQVFSILLSAENKQQLLVPKGFAHGFSVLSETADVLYKCDALYNKESESGICYNDAELAIDWKVPLDQVIVSEKDLVLSSFNDLDSNF
jgi:dTDP-4-dehydrorhamnose 3,5-epimerase